MKKLLLLILLTSTLCQAQSSFFVGANGSMNMTTLLNKEDKSAPKGMLEKKNGIQPGYGIQLGYSIHNRFAISLEPNRLQYKVNYSGASDTANVRSFEASARFTYYQIPLVLTYKQPILERLSINAGVGISYNYMSKDREELKGNIVPIGSPNDFFTYSIDVTGKSGHSEIKELSYGVWQIEYEKPNYINKSFSYYLNVGANYSLQDKINLFINIQYQKGLNDIENKGIRNESYTDKDGFTNPDKVNNWNENNYLRYYYRYPDKYNQRKETYTQAIGLGIGINYYFNGGLLKSSH